MTGYQVSLLRGINVGGRNRVAMARLRAIYERLGCRDVTTYVQSGNVVLRADDDPADLSERAVAAIGLELGLDIQVLGRTHDNLARIVADDPYPNADPIHHHVVFLSGSPRPEGLVALADAAADGEAFTATDREIHLLLPDGAGRSKLGPALIERRLGVVGTARNWRTVSQLHDLSRPRG
jgi:uncharacterized protein (DUF1697 family)